MRKIPFLLVALGLHPIMARAQIDPDSSPKGFLLDLVANSENVAERRKLAKEAISDLKDEIREKSKKADPNEVRQLKDDVKRLTAERRLFVETQNAFYTQLTSDKTLGDLVKNAFASKQADLTKMAQAAADRVNDPNAAKTAVAPIVSEPLALAGTPFKLIATASLDDKNQMSVKFTIDPKSIDPSVYSSSVTNVLSPDDIRSNLADLNKVLSDGSGSFLSASTPADAYKTLTSSGFLAKLRDQQLLGHDAKLKSALTDAQTKIGDPKNPDSDSLIGQKLDDLKDKSDTSEKDEELKELRAKQKIAEWLRDNDPGTTDPCDILVKAVGGFAQLPKSSQMECSDLDPAKKAKADAEAKKQADADKQADATDAAKGSALLSLSQQMCQGLVASRAAQAGIKTVNDLVDPIYGQLLAQGFGSSVLFGQLIGDAAVLDSCVRAYQLQQQMNPQVAVPNTCDASDFNEKARSMVAGYSNDAAGTADLKKEATELQKILSRTGISLNALAATSPLGLADPAFAGNPKVMGMLRNKLTASTLLQAINTELANRTQANQTRLHAVGPGSGGGIPVVGGSSAPSAVAPFSPGMNVGSPSNLRPADAARNFRMNSPQTNNYLQH